MIIDISPERIEPHTKVKGAINLGIGNLVEDEDLGTFYPDGALITHVQAGLSNEPDASFASWDTLESGRLREIHRKRDAVDYMELEGTPDWVCEIVSLSSVRKDAKLLFEAYYAAGIPEYWLIDANGDAIDFHVFRPGRTASHPPTRMASGGCRASSTGGSGKNASTTAAACGSTSSSSAHCDGASFIERA